jgi:hypothetical protein
MVGIGTFRDLLGIPLKRLLKPLIGSSPSAKHAGEWALLPREVGLRSARSGR